MIDEICRIILTHDSNPAALTLEEAIVKDADKVWRVSRAGFPLALDLLANMTPQELHDFVAVRVPRWFLTRAGRKFAEEELAARRLEYGLEPAPNIPPPGDFGIGDAAEYSSLCRHGRPEGGGVARGGSHGALAEIHRPATAGGPDE